ncbi:purine nucleoside permease [Sphingomonas sp. MMS12-HWE2-04]|uniref:purine nucleoside permease n=1 Tax=Sphingomonas sp. MMS12-HWE2-04 TaxID=3234199 RepID=UPI00385115D7
MGFLRRFLLIVTIGLSTVAPAAQAQPAPIEIRVVIVTAFEIGADTGDRAGEFQAWAETMPQVVPFPAGFRDLRHDPKRGVLLLHTGIGTNRAAASVMALGMDPRFDLSHAYWLVAAIAGVDPAAGSIGSAAWIGDIVDTDYGYAVDPREAPKGWTSGMFARDRTAPYQGPRPDPQYNLFPLNKPLRDWAYGLTKDVAIADSDTLRAIRAPFAKFPAAIRPPRVLKGAEASGQTFWHGTLLNAHVERWVRYWTDGGEPFVMTGMEDTGVAGALDQLARAGRADRARLMVLRTGSNYSVQPPGTGAAESLTAEAKGLSALQASLDAAFQIGTPVVDALATGWDRYRTQPPSTATEAPAQ